ncbi:MAG: peptide deformylase [Candidatus Levybacteria bacterium]|nr:peptide deformylase [Candidatus Levybacteria bacterium]
MLKIVSAPNNVLSEKAKEVSKIDKNILYLIEEMKVTLDNTHDPEGIGLAAPQVGKNLQIFIVKPTRKSKTQVFINPQIEARGDLTGRAPDNAQSVVPKAHLGQALAGGKEEAGPRANESGSTKLEGCLSLPNIWGEVIREPQVVISYLDEHKKHHKKNFKGFIATIIQHEHDHLQGTLFPKRVLEQKGKLYKSSKNKKGEDEFEEIEI